MGKDQLALLMLATVVGPGLTLVACNPRSAASPGAGAGGSSGLGGAGASCASVTACGGELAGTWTVTSSCLEVAGDIDLSLFGAGCPSAPVTGSLQVTGAWTANADGTYSDETTTSGTEQLTLAASCLVISSTQVTCSGAAGLLTS